METKVNELACTAERSGDAEASTPLGSDCEPGALEDAGSSTEGAERLLAEGEAAALAPNTRRAYDTGWKSWRSWAIARGAAVFPAAPDELKRWLAALAAEGKRHSTLRAYLTTVKHWHRHHPGPNPARDPEVRGLSSGFARLAAARGESPRQAFGLRWHHIMRIVDTAHSPRRNQPGGREETADQARQRGDFDIAMVCVAHDALLRCSELLALRWADIDLPEGGGCGTVRIRRSKTDQHGEGAAAPISEYTCQALARLKPADARPHDPVFKISPNTVTRRIKAAAQAAGIAPEGVSSHSPRVGMAQDLAAAGISMAGLMLAGRWTTATTPARYIKNLAAHHTPAAQYLKTQQPPPAKTPGKVIHRRLGGGSIP